MPCGVVIVDDAADLRLLLVFALGRDPRLTVLADVEDGAQAIEAVREHEPDVVLMDVAMPVMDGITATRLLTRDHPDLPVVVFTGYGDGRVEAEAREAGAAAFLDKTVPLTTVADTLVEIARARPVGG
ncbi:response regulator transcription factor [Egicoccus sp. AB-alg6-2]|uniref:response regulator n=1 Tax=Egicoccus sp. AB-alg6-2 TaxID=3242692 RepID=UPI00359EF9A7